MATDLPHDGSFSAPPAGAPTTATDGTVPRISPREIAERQAQAAARAAERQAAGETHIAVPPAGEVELRPFDPPRMTREQMIAVLGPARFAQLEAAGQVAAEPQGPGVIPAIAGVVVASAASVPADAPADAAGEPTATTAAPAPAPVPTSSIKPPDVPLPFKSRFRPVPAAASAAPPLSTGTVESSRLPAAAPLNEAVPVAESAATSAPAAAAEPRSARPPIAEPTAVVTPAAPPPPSAHQPAASDTDTPSRGIPRPIDDPGKKITGGFGDVIEAQYFPIDGSEAAVLVRGLLSEIDVRLDDDLRFSRAVTYPRIRIRVDVTVECYAADPFTIPRVAPPHDKTPVEIARQRGDECVFVVVAERQEMTAAGESIQPPNAIRQELGIPIPGKRYVQTPGGRILVDIAGG